MATETELIRIETLENGVQAVSARTLHEFLESKERFSKWFNKVLDYGFVQDEDYAPYQTVHPQNGQEITDYAMTLEMAKEAAMVSRLPKGKQARQYFIECERQLQTMQQDSYIIFDPVARAQKWIAEEEERQRLQALADQQAAEIEAAAPKLEYHDRVLRASANSVTTTEVAADYGMSAIRLNRILMDLHIQYKRGSRYYLYARYNDKQYADSDTITYDHDTKSKTSLKWTQAGREFIFTKLRGIGINPVGYADEEISQEEQERLDYGVINSTLH